MGASIYIDGSDEVWISNAEKDSFCEIVVEVAKNLGLDVSAVFRDAPGISGTYRVLGMFVNATEFYPYFGGRKNFRAHLDLCTAHIPSMPELSTAMKGCMLQTFEEVKREMDRLGVQ